MKNIHTIIGCLLLVALFSSCIKDKGNYTYTNNSGVEIGFAEKRMQSFLGEKVIITPQLIFKEGKDATAFKPRWFSNGKLLSEQMPLELNLAEAGEIDLILVLEDNASGFQNTSERVFLKVVNPYDEGYAFLYEKNGQSEIGHARLFNGQFVDFTDVYGKMNDGAELGGEPVRLREYVVTGYKKGVMVVQHAGQGSVELSGTNYKKQLTVAEAFKNNPPVGLKPVDMVGFQFGDYLLNEDGQLYYRYFSSPIPFTTPWKPVPLVVPGGAHVKDIWRQRINGEKQAVMYDEQHNRLLFALSLNGDLTLKQFPPADPAYPYPAGFPPVNDLGTHQYIWGDALSIGTNDKNVMLLRDPLDQKVYFHSFDYLAYVNPTVKPGRRAVLPEGDKITAKSKFTVMLNQQYILFTGGPNNDQLYYYDCVTGVPTELYIQTESPVVAMASSLANASTVAVAMENGTIVIYEFSQQTILSKQPRELHRITDLGKITDIITRGSW